MQEIGRSADKSFAYILGVYLGDGCVTRMGNGRYEVFKLNTIDRDFAEAVKAALLDYGVTLCSFHEHAVAKSKKPNYALQARNEVLTFTLKVLTRGKTILPVLDEWGREEKLALVSGLMDSEGYVAANGNPTNRRFYMGFKSCDPWVPDFIRLLESLGIRTGKVGVEKPRKPWYKTPMRFTIKMQSWIDSGARFNIARKQKRVEEWASAGPYERRAKFPRRLISETNTPDAA